MSYSLSIGACENKLVISPLPLKPSVIEVKFLPTAIIKNTKTAIAINTHNNLSNKVQQDHIICQGKIVKSTWNKQHNFMIINRGEKDSITSNMGVIYNNYLVGITNNVSKHFTKIISIINTDLMISAKLQHSGYYGSLNWDGKDSDIVQ